MENVRMRYVLSGISKESVLGPILFVIYINTLPNEVRDSEVYLLADDIKVFKGVFKDEDCDKLQVDIDNIIHWTDNSLLKFHPVKCGVMRIGKSEVANRTYTMGSEQFDLKNVEEKDIGIKIDNNLSFMNHMTAKVNNANDIMG